MAIRRTFDDIGGEAVEIPVDIPTRPIDDITTRRTEPDLEVPVGAYREQKFDNVTVSGNPVDQSIVDLVFQSTEEPNVSYRWQGLQDFNAGKYRFSVRAQDGVRVIVAGDTIVDEWSATERRRAIMEEKEMPQGLSLVTVEWFKTGGTKRIEMVFEEIDLQNWVSCEDGEEHRGSPPDGWILTADGCWRAPTEIEDSEPVNLADVVQITPDTSVQVERAYVLNSGVQLTPYMLNFYNRSTNMSVIIAMDGPEVVTFSEQSFELAVQESKEVQVDFIQEKMNEMEEGLNLSSIVATLSAGTITLTPDSDDNIHIGIPDIENPTGPLIPVPDPTTIENPTGPLIPVPPPTTDPIDYPPPVTWCDASGAETVQRNGVAPTNWVQRQDGCYVPPMPPEPTVEITTRFVELAPSISNGINIAAGQLAAGLSGDDPNSWSWTWDLDVLSQGAGTGNTALQSLTAQWVMTESDLRLLENEGQTTRTVEAIARNGNDVKRSRLVVVFRDPRLAVIVAPPAPPPPNVAVPPPLTQPTQPTTVIIRDQRGGEAEAFVDPEDDRNFLF